MGPSHPRWDLVLLCASVFFCLVGFSLLGFFLYSAVSGLIGVLRTLFLLLATPPAAVDASALSAGYASVGFTPGAGPW